MKKFILISFILASALFLTACSTNYFEVSFFSGGEPVLEVIVLEEGEVLPKPAEITKEGYIFLFWSDHGVIDRQFNFNTPITQDISLYAVWEALPEQPGTALFDPFGQLMPNYIWSAGHLVASPASPLYLPTATEDVSVWIVPYIAIDHSGENYEAAHEIATTFRGMDITLMRVVGDIVSAHTADVLATEQGHEAFEAEVLAEIQSLFENGELIVTISVVVFGLPVSGFPMP